MKTNNFKPSQIGGKGANLKQLTTWGYAVPEFMIIPADSRDFGEEVETFLAGFPRETFAVRSSASVEDASEKSFAGQFQTFLNVSVDRVPSKIEAVRESLNAEQVQRYAKERGFSMAVVVQRMVSADVSGVVFGADPVSGDRSQCIVSATYGLGEGLVSGALDADTFRYSKAHWQSEVTEKTEKKVFSNNGLKSAEVSLDRVNQPCLEQEQLDKIKTISDELTKKFGIPQDIEFSIEGENIWLLQSRPITTLRQTRHNIWDNSNIIESYPGITSPLTFSFITKMYKAVYEQLSEVLGVPQQKIERNERVFERMLALLNGRVYYNLLNWYRVLAMVPGFSLNARFMEKMMGTDETYELPQEDWDGKWQTRWQFFISILKIIKAYFGLQKETRRFQNHFKAVMSRYERMDFTEMPPWEIQNRIQAYEKVLLKEWRAPLVNDFFAMIYFGVFEKAILKWYKGEESSIHNDLLIGSQDIISARPVKLLAEIDQLIRGSSSLKKLFQKEPQAILKGLPEHPKAEKLVKQYLEEFGDRNVGELKLETITYRQEPDLLIKQIKNNLNQRVPLKRSVGAGKNKRLAAEKEVFNNISSWIKRRALRFLLKRTRYLVSMRENLRYQRTRAFGVVRHMFFGLGEKLHQQGELKAPRDIFYLKEEEIFEWLDGASVNMSLQKLVDLRKSEYRSFEEMPTLKDRIETNGLIYPHLSGHFQKAGEINGLKGVACCAGVVEAEVCVINSPEEAEGLNGKILVTASTDPGWITLFYGAGGILVERGSLLSHSAIVSREMGLPCIVAVKGLLSTLKTGDRVRMNGSTGEVEVLMRAKEPQASEGGEAPNRNTVESGRHKKQSI